MFGQGPGNSQNQNRILQVFQENSYHSGLEWLEGWRPTFNSQWMCFVDQPLTRRNAGLCFSRIRLQSHKQMAFFDNKSDMFILCQRLVPLQSSVMCFYFECCRSGWSPSKTTKTQTEREAKKQDFAWNLCPSDVWTVNGFINRATAVMLQLNHRSFTVAYAMFI